MPVMINRRAQSAAVRHRQGRGVPTRGFRQKLLQATSENVVKGDLRAGEQYGRRRGAGQSRPPAQDTACGCRWWTSCSPGRTFAVDMRVKTPANASTPLTFTSPSSASATCSALRSPSAGCWAQPSTCCNAPPPGNPVGGEARRGQRSRNDHRRAKSPAAAPMSCVPSLYMDSYDRKHAQRRPHRVHTPGGASNRHQKTAEFMSLLDYSFDVI
jgi:hypothetical protein